MKWLRELNIKIVNSHWWYHIYYKHSKKHKKNLADVKARVTARRKRILDK